MKEFVLQRELPNRWGHDGDEVSVDVYGKSVILSVEERSEFPSAELTPQEARKIALALLAAANHALGMAAPLPVEVKP